MSSKRYLTQPPYIFGEIRVVRKGFSTVHIERGKITRVWVADLTRLSRDPADLETIRAYLAQHNVEPTVAERDPLFGRFFELL